MDVNSIEQRSRDTFLVFGNDSRGTRTGLLCITEMPTGAGLHTIDHIFRAPKVTRRSFLGYFARLAATIRLFMPDDDVLDRQISFFSTLTFVPPGISTVTSPGSYRT